MKAANFDSNLLEYLQNIPPGNYIENNFIDLF
jgi:hypothetical protein